MFGRGKLCIFHSPDVREKASAFTPALGELLAAARASARPADLDFKGFVFSRIGFRGYAFRGSADFRGAIFVGDVDFRGVSFFQQADFHTTEFRGGAEFFAVYFASTARFLGTIFRGRAIFNGSTA